MTYTIPEKGFIFWPVGNGDSTTIGIDSETLMQVDLNHTVASEDKKDPRFPIVDILEKILPKVDKKPYLSVFVLTHPDEDHCRGFADLLKKVTIGEIWFTPRIFSEYSKELCDDAKAFKTEIKRRVKKCIENSKSIKSGDRVRIIGYDDILKEEDYKDFPSALLSVPGTEITLIDGKDCSSLFRAFVHAPFKDDIEGDRNETSLGLQINLIAEKYVGQTLLLGDLSYPIIKKILSRSKSTDLQWDVFLAPHHCSKSVMYWKDEGEKEETLKKDLLDKIEKSGKGSNYIISSSNPVPSSNKDGDSPPHAIAKSRYEEIVAKEFICTMENPNEEKPQPTIFVVEKDAIKCLSSKSSDTNKGQSIPSIVAAAREDEKPPTAQVGFGAK